MFASDLTAELRLRNSRYELEKQSDCNFDIRNTRTSTPPVQVQVRLTDRTIFEGDSPLDQNCLASLGLHSAAKGWDETETRVSIP
jgi:hypothetical protein